MDSRHMWDIFRKNRAYGPCSQVTMTQAPNAGFTGMESEEMQNVVTPEWKPRRPFTFTGIYDGLTEMEIRMAENAVMFGMMNDTLGDVMNEQGEMIGDLAEINGDLRETHETDQLQWAEIGKLWREIDELDEALYQQGWVIAVLVVLVAILSVATVTSLVWIWKIV